jgi:hypothetical protein
MILVGRIQSSEDAAQIHVEMICAGKVPKLRGTLPFTVLVVCVFNSALPRIEIRD